jgi:hypothetical protein
MSGLERERERERESSSGQNQGLTDARKAKKDEFYTQITDIEKEIVHYRPHLKGATIFCNCDDPVESNFFRYFALNFEFLGLKKLITTHYDSEKPTYKLEITRELDINDDGKIDMSDAVKTSLKTNGDFRSPESVELLKEADIVITNPPFSLFREYVSQLVEYKKKFLILGNVNAITYKETFSHIRDNRIWVGPSISSGDREFRVPDDYPLNASGTRVDDQGNKYIRVKGVRWFTNMDFPKRYEELPLHKSYNPKEYPEYDDYEAINVNKVSDIPVDYDGPMGVPITFIDKHNPKQFKILGMDDHRLVLPDWRGRGPVLNGKNIYRRIIIQKKQKKQKQ